MLLLILHNRHRAFLHFLSFRTLLLDVLANSRHHLGVGWELDLIQLRNLRTFLPSRHEGECDLALLQGLLRFDPLGRLRQPLAHLHQRDAYRLALVKFKRLFYILPCRLVLRFHHRCEGRLKIVNLLAHLLNVLLLRLLIDLHLHAVDFPHVEDYFDLVVVIQLFPLFV